MRAKPLPPERSLAEKLGDTSEARVREIAAMLDAISPRRRAERECAWAQDEAMENTRHAERLGETEQMEFVDNLLAGAELRRRAAALVPKPARPAHAPRLDWLRSLVRVWAAYHQKHAQRRPAPSGWRPTRKGLSSSPGFAFIFEAVRLTAPQPVTTDQVRRALVKVMRQPRRNAKSHPSAR